MISLYAEAGLPPQNRLLDHDKKALYSMSMSELYALGMVAELSIMRGCNMQSANNIPLASLPQGAGRPLIF